MNEWLSVLNNTVCKTYLFKVNNKNPRKRGAEKHVQSKQRHKNDVIDVVLVPLLITWNIFYTFF